MISPATCLHLLVVTLGVLAAPALSTAQPVYVPYDGFAKFDPTKWRGNEFQPGTNQELSRTIVKGQLQLFLLSWGSEADNTGLSGFGSTGVRHPDPASVAGIQALVTVVQATAQACPDNDDPNNQPTVRAEIRGAFFNDGTSTGPGDLTGDVIARLEKRYAHFGNVVPQMRIRLQVLRCTDPACNNAVGITGSPVTLPVPDWKLGEGHVLRLLWDPGADMFVATVLDAKGKNVLGPPQALSYGDPPESLSDADPPRNPFKELRVQAGNPNCTDGATISAIQALFDNVATAEPF